MVASVVGTPDGDVEAAWDAEIEARISALDRGEVALLDADEVLAELRRRLGQQ